VIGPVVGPRIITGDIETSPLDSYTWGLFDQNVGLNQIKGEWRILSYCVKPLGGKLKYKDNRNASNPLDDSELLEDLWKILDEYDFLIAQNGKRFDLRKIRARLILEGFKPHSPIQVIDTMLMARQVAAFTSNKLEWLAQYLSAVPKSKHKEFPGFELWAECLKGNPKAWRAMRKYNIPDVIACEEVYLKLRPWVTSHPNLAAFVHKDEMLCPRCLSTDVVRKGYRYTNAGKYPRYRCNSCGGWAHGRYTENTLAKRKSLLGT
jgi:RNase_H superfamily/InsA N-terminal domain